MYLNFIWQNDKMKNYHMLQIVLAHTGHSSLILPYYISKFLNAIIICMICSYKLISIFCYCFSFCLFRNIVVYEFFHFIYNCSCQKRFTSSRVPASTRWTTRLSSPRGGTIVLHFGHSTASVSPLGVRRVSTGLGFPS